MGRQTVVKCQCLAQLPLCCFHLVATLDALDGGGMLKALQGIKKTMAYLSKEVLFVLARKTKRLSSHPCGAAYLKFNVVKTAMEQVAYFVLILYSY